MSGNRSGGPRKSLWEWLAQYRRFWARSFDRLDNYLREIQAKARGDKDGKD